MSRMPKWIRASLQTDKKFVAVSNVLSCGNLHTVCQSARCPNQGECWNSGTATFMILGDTCTRDCRFCAVSPGKPPHPDSGEPERVAAAARQMRLSHIVVTSVTRDDLSDGGASVFARTIRAIRSAIPGATVEVLTPDFKGNPSALDIVLDARPEVFAHNVETVRRLQPLIRPQASYECSLQVLRHAADSSKPIAVKSGLMVGLGESDGEIEEALRDMHAAGCELLTLGQYLSPSRAHAPVERYVEPSAFDRYAEMARRIGFQGIASGPLVRSSYRAAELMKLAFPWTPVDA